MQIKLNQSFLPSSLLILIFCYKNTKLTHQSGCNHFHTWALQTHSLQEIVTFKQLMTHSAVLKPQLIHQLELCSSIFLEVDMYIPWLNVREVLWGFCFNEWSIYIEENVEMLRISVFSQRGQTGWELQGFRRVGEL